MLPLFPSDPCSGVIDRRTLHEAEPAGDEKWVLQLWVRQFATGGQGALRQE
eukprot:SAG22_NODE_2630_length_2357_cov_1.340567_2_plen_51_part_00